MYTQCMYVCVRQTSLSYNTITYFNPLDFEYESVFFVKGNYLFKWMDTERAIHANCLKNMLNRTLWSKQWGRDKLPRQENQTIDRIHCFFYKLDRNI